MQLKSRKNAPGANAPGAFSSNFLFFFKHILAKTASRANPILRHIFPRCTRRNAVIGVAYLRIIYIAARANIFFHIYYLRFL